jgi:hypothetical protein
MEAGKSQMKRELLTQNHKYHKLGQLHAICDAHMQLISKECSQSKN